MSITHVDVLSDTIRRTDMHKVFGSTVDVVSTWKYGGAHNMTISIVKGLTFCWCNV